MRTLKILIPLLLLTGVAVAEEYPDFVAWMKSIGASSENLRKMDKAVGPQATGDAERIAGNFEQMSGFFRSRYSSDGAKFAEAGKAAAVEMASAASAGNAEASAAAFKKLAGTCRPCHDARREKTADGKYRVK